MGKAARAVRRGTQSDFVKKFEALAGRYSVRQIWEDWVISSAIAISNVVDNVHAPEREKHYMNIISKYSKEELTVFPELLADMISALEANPNQDFLGEMYMAVGMGNDKAGQFFTPYCVCETMAKMTSTDLQARIDRDGFISVCDPACGAGALLVAFANECLSQKINYQTSVLFVAQDIDFLVACMCYLQLSLLGCPGYVKIGDSLARPSTSHDPRGLLPCDDGNIWYTPFFFRDEWNWRKQAAMLKLFFGREASQSAEEPQPIVEAPPAPILEYAATESGQLTLF